MFVNTLCCELIGGELMELDIIDGLLSVLVEIKT